MDLDVAQALWTLEMLPREEMPDIAIAALEARIDNIPVRMLAGLTADDLDDAENLFEEVLKYLGRGNLTKNDAACLYTQFISSQILRGDVEPYVGAKKIWEAALKTSDANFHNVDAFIYAASEYEDRPSDREFFNQEIQNEAKRWVTTT